MHEQVLVRSGRPGAAVLVEHVLRRVKRLVEGRMLLGGQLGVLVIQDGQVHGRDGLLSCVVFVLHGADLSEFLLQEVLVLLVDVLHGRVLLDDESS